MFNQFNAKSESKIDFSQQNMENVMSHAKIKTFKNIGRRSSKYNLLEEAKNLILFQDLTSNKKDINKDKEKEIPLNKQLDTNISLSYITDLSITSKEKNKNVSKKKSISLNRYKENQLPVITNSKQILGEIDMITKRNNYYMKFIGNNNFGYKYVRHNPAYQSYDKKDEEEFIQLMGLNDEEKDPLSVIHNKIYKINEKLEIKRDNANYLLFHTAQMKIDAKRYKDKLKKQKQMMMNYNFLMQNNMKNKFSKKKKEVIYSLMKKDEFSDFLITNYLKVNYPNFLNDSNHSIFSNVSINNNNKNKNQKGKKIKYERRKIYVIKDSTIISNPSQIPGFIAEIPSIKEMKSFSSQKRILIMRQFYEFAADKFRTHLTFKYIFCKDRSSIIDFADLPENQKYIFVSPNSIFQGLSIPLNKNIIQLYLKHFTEEEGDNFYFNESSNENSIENEKNYKPKDDVYDIFLSNNFEKKKFFKKRKKYQNKNKLKLNTSFTFGIEENKYEYINYSDDENRKKEFHENHYKYYKNKLDFYIKSQNELFDNRIKLLLSKLKTNKDGSIKNINKFKKRKKSKNELIQCYLTEKHIPKKNMLKDQFENKPLKGQDIVDAFNLLKSKDPKININKFVKLRKNSNSNLPFVLKNIKDNSCKYCYNRKKTDLEYPSILSYNLPMVVKTHPKYNLTDLIKYYTKFKSLVNLWLNMHSNADLMQYGIDFETFHRCTEDLCEEEELLVKKIFDKINSGTSGVLSLEDYVDALTIMNSNDILDQIEFFMRIFNSKDKEVFNYEDILGICKISIKRLIKGKNNEETENVVMELGSFLAEYILKICGADKDSGVKISQLKDILMNDEKNIEYLKLFMCSFGDEKIKKQKEKKDESELHIFKKELKFSIEDELKNMK